MPVIQLLSQ